MNYYEGSDSEGDETFNSVVSDLEEPDTPLSPSHPHFQYQTSPPPTSQVLRGAALHLQTVEAIQQVQPNWPPLLPEEEVLEGQVVAAPEIESNADAGSEPDTPIIMAAPYDTSTGEDAADAYQKIASLKMPFNTIDPKYWFNNFERKLKTFGVQGQRTKKDALHGQLQSEVEEEVKGLLRLDETEEGETPYKVLKQELIRLYAPKAEDAYDKAASRVMSGKPSTLARQQINDLCECQVTLSCPCCAKIIFGMWRKNLPNQVKAHISNHKFDKDTYLEVLEIADNVWSSHKTPSQTVAAATTAPAPPPTPSATTPVAAAATPQVAAATTSRGRGGQNRGGRGRGFGSNRGANQRGNGAANRGGNRGGGQGQGRGNANAAQPLQYHPRHRGPRHNSLPPLECCRTHWLFGGQAKWCEDSFTCPWKNFVSSE